MEMQLRLDDAPYATAAAPVCNGGYVPASYWQETVTVHPLPPLQQDGVCDVAILGGGFTGLSVAIAVKEAAPQLDVVLLERAVVGHGASGRNGGFAMPLLGWDLTDAANKLGELRARDAYQMMYTAVDHLRGTIERHGIPCDMEETGYLLLATCARRVPRVKHEAELGKRLGFNLEWLEGSALREHIASKSFVGGCFDPKPFIVNPAKLARGLLDVARRLGVRVYEQTSVDGLDDGSPIVVRTPGGTLSAQQAVLAMNGYGGAMGFMQHRIFPVHTYIILTEPLGQSDLEATGWQLHRTSLETARNFIHYFRLTADNRILFGGEDATLYYGGRYHDQDAGMFHALERRFRSYFPELGHIPISHRWGGVLGVTLDMFPTVGSNGSAGTIYHAAGYSGHGVALSNYAGALLAPRILARAGIDLRHSRVETPFFWNRWPVALPPDPLRYAGMQAYRWTLKLQDTLQGA